MPVSDGTRTNRFDEFSIEPDIDDQFAIPYPLATRSRSRLSTKTPADPQRAIVSQNVRRLPQGRGSYGSIRCPGCRAARRFGHGDHRQRRERAAGGRGEGSRTASRRHDAIPGAGSRHLQLPAIAGTGRLSVHAFGAAIDINTQFSDYWQWSKPDPRLEESYSRPRSARFSSVTASSGAPSGIISIPCISSIAPRSSSRGQTTEDGRQRRNVRILRRNLTSDFRSLNSVF